LHGSPKGAILWFGVPRYLFRALFTDVCKWLPRIGRHRFCCKLQVYETLGTIFEACQSHSQRHASGPNQRLATLPPRSPELADNRGTSRFNPFAN
jgi:hypothetical protein